MPHALRKKICWFCGKDYLAAKPHFQLHEACRKAHRKQVAAEQAAARNSCRIGPSPEFKSALADLMAPRRPAEPPLVFTDYPPSMDDDLTPGMAFPIREMPRIVNLAVPGSEPQKILVIPDTQVKPGVPVDHMAWAGKYAADKRPDVIVHLGDHWDMQSLSSYDVGKKSYEGRRYVDDIAVGRQALQLFDYELAKVPDYHPRKVFLIGNHEQRIERAINNDRKLEGLIGYQDFGLEEAGWEVHDFLVPVKIAGIEFAHYFVSGSKGNAASSPAVVLGRRQGSAIMGHNQVFAIASHPLTHTMAIFAGSFYQHDEQYLTPQDRAHRRHLLMLHEAHDGIFDLMMVSLDFLRRRFA